MTKERKKYWDDHCIHSTYHESKKHEFYDEVLDETDTMLLLKSYPEQGMCEEPAWLRKSLIGSLYEVVKKPDKYKRKTQQLSIFDLI